MCIPNLLSAESAQSACHKNSVTISQPCIFSLKTQITAHAKTLKRQNAKTSNPFFILIILCIPNLFKKSALSAKSACHKTPKIKNYLLAGEINRHNEQANPHLLDFQLNRDWI